MKDSKNLDGGVDENKVVKDEFMGNVSEEEDKIDDLFGEARPGEGVGKVEDFDEGSEVDVEGTASGFLDASYCFFCCRII